MNIIHFMIRSIKIKHNHSYLLDIIIKYMKSQIFLIALLISVASLNQVSTNYFGTINSTTSIQSYTFNLTAGYLVLNIQFTITNIINSNTLIYISLTPINTFFTLENITNFLKTNDPILNYMDPLLAMGGYTQNINIPTTLSQSILYVAIYNFDPPQITTNKNFNLVVTQTLSTVYCLFRCPYGSTYSAGYSCQCRPCSTNYVGTYCQNYLRDLSGAGTTVVSIPSAQNQYFIIYDSGKEVSLSVSQTSGNFVKLYIQYQYSQNMIAGKLNKYYDNQNNSYEYTVGNSTSSIRVPSFGINILLTLRNYNYSSTNVTIVNTTPTSPQKKNGDAIIIAITFSILAFLLVTSGVVYKLRNRCRRQPSTVINASEALIKDENSLTDRQINKYFPQVKVALVFHLSEINPSSSGINLKQTQYQDTQIEINYQCSICFDTIKKDDLIRVTYCKHIFHGKCLFEWFHKNQNCPNCRQNFDYQNTHKLRQNLSKQSKINAYSLVKQILGEKYFQSLKKHQSGGEKQLKQLDSLDKIQKYQQQQEQSQQQQQEREARDNELRQA